jgi:aminoglycoside 6'-N-acetyltransferase
VTLSSKTTLNLRDMAEEDLPLVTGWLHEPHVARWWLAGSTVEREIEELREHIVREQPGRVLMVLEQDRPVGWCQWYLCRDHAAHATAIGAERDDIGIDYAIGDPARTRNGLGTELIAALVATVRLEHPAAGLVADPEAANIASRRVLEKNGFQLLRESPVASEPTDAVMAIYRLAPSCDPRSPQRS